MAPGFLAVFAQPSSQLPLDEFNAWYDEEHIPLRLNHLPSFLSGARYFSIDSPAPFTNEDRKMWLAMYEIDDTQTFSHPSYTGLRETRSERESGVMSRLQVLVRKTGMALGIWGAGEGEKTSGMKVGNPSRFLVTHGLCVRGEDQDENDRKVRSWADELVAKDGERDFWVRMRVVKVLDTGKTKMNVNVKLDDEEAKMNYLIIHEFQTEKNPDDGGKFRREVERIGNGIVMGEWGVWKLYAAYPSIAQGNLPP